MKNLFRETADIETAGEDYAARFDGEVGKYFLAVQADIVTSLLGDIGDASLLDVGGGHAQLAPSLTAAGFRVTCTGSDESCRNRLDRCMGPGTFQYETCDSLNLPFADGSFDVVISFRLLPHAENWQGIISEMCRVARTCVVFDYPDLRSSNIMYKFLFSMKKNIEKNTRTYTMFTRSQMRAELAKNRYYDTTFRPQFFWPMVLHRKLANAALSRAFELPCSLLGLTRLLGSPVIVRADRAC